MRHQDDEARRDAVDYLVRAAEDIARHRGLAVEWNVVMNQRAVAMDPLLVSQVEQSVSNAGCEPHRMVSGAGHDAMIMAVKVPSAMIFLRYARRYQPRSG